MLLLAVVVVSPRCLQPNDFSENNPCRPVLSRPQQRNLRRDVEKNYSNFYLQESGRRPIKISLQGKKNSEEHLDSTESDVDRPKGRGAAGKLAGTTSLRLPLRYLYYYVPYHTECTKYCLYSITPSNASLYDTNISGEDLRLLLLLIRCIFKKKILGSSHFAFYGKKMMIGSTRRRDDDR